MNNHELARDKLKYWSLIARAQKVNFPVPQHWMKYGNAPTNASEICLVCLEAIADKFTDLFEQDSTFYNRIIKRA